MNVPVAPWRRLDRRMLAIQPLLEVGRAFPALLGLFLAGQGTGHGSRWSLIGTAVVIAGATTRWFTTRYRITPTQIQLRHGLVRRRTTAAALDRVRTVDVTAHALHRLLGLARVVIGTGISDRSGKSQLRLDGLRTADAARLRDELLHRTRIAVPAQETELLRLPPIWLRYAPFTLSGAVTAAAIAGFAWRVDSEAHLDPNRIGPFRSLTEHVRHAPLWLDVVEIGASALAFVILASTAGYLLAFWGFRLTRHAGGTLHIVRGLITSRATSIEERRLRGAEVSEPLLLRAVGGARTLAIATGLRVGRGAERGGTILMPPGPRAEAVRVGAEVVGTTTPFIAGLTSHGPRARRRRYVRALAAAIIAIGLTVTGWELADASGWGWLASLALVPLGAALATDRACSLGHAVWDGYLVTQRGSLIRRRVALAQAGVIGVNLRASFFQRRAGLVTLTATTAAGRQGYRVQDVPDTEALRLAGALLPGALSEFLGSGPS